MCVHITGRSWDSWEWDSYISGRHRGLVSGATLSRHSVMPLGPGQGLRGPKWGPWGCWGWERALTAQAVDPGAEA